MEINQKSLIHKRCSNFKDFIAIEKDKEDGIRKQANDIADRIKAKAEEDGQIVMSTPFSGSFGKRTGLRRYLQGQSEEEGMDIDIGFILKPDKEIDDLTCQIDAFEQYARSSFPDSEISTTKSSAVIHFKAAKRSFDLVPFYHLQDTRQLLIRSNGERRETSVKQHAEIVKSRSQVSNAIPGAVRFNECVRLMKWWRSHQQIGSGTFYEGGGVEKIPSFLIDLLCASAFDRLSVKRTYPETIHRWFSFLANVVRNRKPIVFTDYEKHPSIDSSTEWCVADPVESSNNVVAQWRSMHVDELATWLENGRDRMAEAIRKDLEGDSVGSLNCLVEIFGNSFKNNCD